MLLINIGAVDESEEMMKLHTKFDSEELPKIVALLIERETPDPAAAARTLAVIRQ
jgi:hypothetical protein